MAELDALIARLEAADGGRFVLDCEIAKLVGEWPTAPPKPYTVSLDAALTLVPEGMAADVHVGPSGIYNTATVWQPVKGQDDQGRRTTSFTPYIGGAPKDGTLQRNTPPLAVCIAALKARMSLTHK